MPSKKPGLTRATLSFLLRSSYWFFVSSLLLALYEFFRGLSRMILYVRLALLVACFCSAYSSTVKMDTVRVSKSSVPPQDRTL
jgi:hypothetical protein